MTTAGELAAAHARGARSVRATLEETLEALEAADEALGAVAGLARDSARRRADVLDAARAHGFPCGPLFGVPVLLKSNLCYAGHESNCGSRLLAGYRSPFTATVVERLLDAGAVVVGHAHMDEFAMGSSGENSAYRATRNPWDPARVPGGSSSGCAAAVAARLVPLALGSDTGGSVRQPAALCGISGFKPSYGRFSRHGLVAFGSSLDQVGPLATSVADLELVLEALSGLDVRDATTLPGPPLARGTRSSLEGLRVGVPREYLGAGLDPRVREVIEGALETLVAAGAVRVPLELPGTELAIATYYVVATAEAASNLARFDGVRYGVRVEGDGSLAAMMGATRARGLGAEVKRRILLGTFVLSHGFQEAWYGHATAHRAALAAEFRAAFERVDVIVGPTTPAPAFRLGEKHADPLAMYLADALTVPASLAGLPAVSVPAGFVREDEHDLPVGLQWLGPAGGDAELLAAARLFQGLTDHHRAVPPAWALA